MTLIHQCGCGFATDDELWFTSHQAQHFFKAKQREHTYQEVAMSNHDSQDDQQDEEYRCSVCGGTIAIFQGHGEQWLHYTGDGTAADPVRIYPAGHLAAP